MFRDRGNARLQSTGEPIQVIASPLAVAPGTKKPSKWKRLFSRKKAVPEPPAQKSYENHASNNRPANQDIEAPRIARPVQQPAEIPRSTPIESPRADSAVEVRRSTTSSKIDNRDVSRTNTSVQAPISEVPKHIKDARRKSWRQSFSRQKSNQGELQAPDVPRYVPVERSLPITRPRNYEGNTARANRLSHVSVSIQAPISETPAPVKSPRPMSFMRTISRQKSDKDIHDMEMRTFNRAKENEGKGLIRQYREEVVNGPGVAAYVPKHAASDMVKTTTRLQRPELSRNPTSETRKQSPTELVRQTTRSLERARQSSPTELTRQNTGSLEHERQSSLAALTGHPTSDLERNRQSALMELTGQSPTEPNQPVAAHSVPLPISAQAQSFAPSRADTPLSIQSSKYPITPPSTTPVGDSVLKSASDQEESDFQDFLCESRLSSSKNYSLQIGPDDSEPNFLAPTPQRKRPLSGAVMDNIMANRHPTMAASNPALGGGKEGNHAGNLGLGRMGSTVSKSSKASKSVKQANRRSFVGSIAGYIKPSSQAPSVAALQVNNNRNSFVSAQPNNNRNSFISVKDNDWDSMNGSMYRSDGGIGSSIKDGGVNGDGESKEGKRNSRRWSLKRTLSRDREAENDERMRASRALELQKAKRERRRSGMPPTGNPQLERYNSGVRGGMGRAGGGYDQLG